MAVALEGTPVEDHATWHGNGTGGVQIATGLTTTQAALLVAVVGCNRGAGVATVTGITSTSGLTWTKRSKKSTSSTDFSTIEIWTAPAVAAVTAEKITVTTDVNVNAGNMVLFALSGLFSTATPFDTDASLTAFNTGIGDPTVTFSTTQAHDLLVFAQAGNKSGAGSAVPSWTTMFNTTNGAGAGAFFAMSVCTLSVSSTQSGTTATGSGGNVASASVAVVDGFTSDNNGGGGGGGTSSVLRTSPTSSQRSFPTPSGRTIPVT